MATRNKTPMTMNEEAIALHFLLGRAISAWASVERSLCAVSSACFTKHNFNSSTLMFFSIDNFRSKLQSVDNLFSTKFDGTKNARDWERIHQTLERLSSIRNKLAHYHAVTYTGIPGRRIILVPILSKTPRLKQKTPKPPAGSLAIRDIAYAIHQFEAVGHALDFLFLRVTKQKHHLPASLTQEGDVPTMEAITYQIRSIFSEMLSP
jgi:hypothetical protein